MRIEKIQNKLGLTERALRRLEREPRSFKGQLTNIADIEALLIEAGCPTDHAIVAFHLDFAGYLTQTGYASNLRLGIPRKPCLYEEAGHWFCEFAVLEPDMSAPAELVMDEHGAIYWNENPMPLASSIQIHLESKAMSEVLKELDMQYFAGGEAKLEIGVEKIPLLHERLTNLCLVVVKEATDAYEQWWISNDSAVHAFKVGSSDGSYSAVVIAANSNSRLKEINEAFIGL